MSTESTGPRYSETRQTKSTVYIKLGAPWENACCELLSSRVRDELLNRKTFFILHKAQVMLERFRIDYKTARPHSARNHMLPLAAIEAAA